MSLFRIESHANEGGMRATSAEEQVVAPTAKKAKHEEQIRVRARDGEEVTLSRDAARLMGTFKDLMDLATSEDGIYPMPTIMASTLQMVCKLNDPDYTWPSSDEPSLFQLTQLIEDDLPVHRPLVLFGLLGSRRRCGLLLGGLRNGFSLGDTPRGASLSSQLECTTGDNSCERERGR